MFLRLQAYFFGALLALTGSSVVRFITFRYEYLAADGNQEAQVTFGTLLLEQLSENTFHGAADSRSLASLLSSPRSSHDESLLKPNVAMNKVAAEGPAAEGDNEFASTSHTTNSRDGSTTLPAAVSRIARAFLNIAGLVGRTLLAVLGLDDLPLALGGTAGLGSANRLSEAAGLASVKNWLLEVRKKQHFFEKRSWSSCFADMCCSLS